MHTFFNFVENKYMRKSTKILLIIFILVTIPSLVLGGSIISGIKATDTAFIFDFDAKGIIALILTLISVILGSILYTRFLMSLKLDKLLFFSSIPLIVIYGAIMFLLADLSNIDSNLAKSVRTLLNMSQDNAYNTILWAILVTIIFIVILSINYLIISKPVTKVERVVSRLGDGKVKEDNFSIGGGKQFKNIEHGLNKINNNYRENDNSLKTADLRKQKSLPKQMLRFFGRNAITELELGRTVKKKATLLYIKLENLSDSNTLEDNFTLFNSYLNVLSPIIRRSSGFIDRYVGSGLLAVFAKAEDAINCSLQLSRTIRITNKSDKNKILLDERISLLSSNVSFGLKDGKLPTIVSNDIEVLEKIDKIAKFMSVKMVFTKSVIDDLPIRYKLAYRYIGFLDIHEMREVMLFEDIDVYPKNIAEKLVKNKGLFERGVICYNNGKYQEALDYFRENLQRYPKDSAGYVYYNKTKEKLS